MLSAIILLAAWALFLNCFSLKKQETNSGYAELLWSILFCCSLATVSSIYLLQINLLPSLVANQWVLGLELAASSAYLAYSFVKKSLARRLISPFKAQYNITKFIIATGFTFLFLFTICTSAPLNWDSNTYNVARISTFLSNASSILGPSTASARQAIYAVGHDILLYPDISFGILRGLPIASLLEFVVLLGTLLGITNAFGKIAMAEKTKALKAAGLIATILLFNSHQQVMQALITKNDLAITLLSTVSIATGLNYLCKQQEHISEKLAMSALFLMLCTAINMKSYGIILIIPTGLMAFIVIIRRLSTNLRKNQPIDLTNPKILHKILIILGISTLISFTIQTSIVHHAWLKANEKRIDSITTDWTNQKGTWSNRFENSLINSGRILLQGSLFPYTTLKPYLPIGAELKSPINDSIIPKALQGSKGTHGGEFSLLYGTNPDMAYPFFGFQIGLILGLLGWCLARPQKGLAVVLFIMTSSALTFLFFSSALLYQPYISRFMGPVYIPLIPLAAIGICIIIQRLAYSLSHPRGYARGIYQMGAFLLGILPLISSTSLTGYISRRAGMPQGKSDFYNQYLWSQIGLSKQEANELIEDLKTSKFDYRYLCSSDGAWTLTPMVLSQENGAFKGNNISLSNMDVCQNRLNELSGSSTKLGPAQSIQIMGTEFISLP